MATQQSADGSDPTAGSFRTAWGDEIAFNLKCVYGSLAAALLYWFLPARNKWVLLLILYAVYLLIAWYDHLYSCVASPLRPTFLYGFYGWAKPAPYRQAYATWQPETKRLVRRVDVGLAVVLLALSPLFLRWQPEQPCVRIC
jgi:nicotinamide riboside transporter PnuC